MVSLSKCDLEHVTFADSRQKEAFSWHAPGDPESTVGVLSEMLFQMKQNVINNPLVEDVPALQSGGKQQMSWCNKVRQNILRLEQAACMMCLLVLVGPSVGRYS